MVNYEEEVQALGTQQTTSGLAWWNPNIGSHKVKIIEEGQEYTTQYRGRDIPKVRFTIQVGGENFNWGVNKGKTFGSLWGQLVVCGKAWGGLAGKEISLVVKMTPRADGSNVREYTILEAVNIQAEQMKTQQAAVQTQLQTQPAQPSGNGNLRMKMDALRGKVFDKTALLSLLGIDEAKFISLVSIGMIEARGGQFVIV